MQLVVCPKCGANNRVDEKRLQESEARCGRCSTALSEIVSTGKPIVVTDNSFEDVVLNSTGPPILLDCWAPWCGPCRMIAPVLDQLAADSNGRYRIAKLNVDENQRTAAKFQVSSIPTMLIFKEGKLIDRIVGAMPKQAILDRLNAAIQ